VLTVNSAIHDSILLDEVVHALVLRSTQADAQTGGLGPLYLVAAHHVVVDGLRHTIVFSVEVAATSSGIVYMAVLDHAVIARVHEDSVAQPGAAPGLVASIVRLHVGYRDVAALVEHDITICGIVDLEVLNRGIFARCEIERPSFDPP